MGRPTKPEQLLVPVSIIQSLTGWNGKWMARARDCGLVKQVCYKDPSTGKKKIRYDLNSLRQEFIIKHNIYAASNDVTKDHGGSR